MIIVSDSEIDPGAWNSLIERNRHASPFQTPAFYNFFNSVSGTSAKAYAITDGIKLLSLAVVTLQGGTGAAGFFSKREIIYGGPLIDDDYPSALGMLLMAIDNHSANPVIYTEIRNLSDYASHRDTFSANGYEYIPYLNFRVDTSDLQALEERLSSSRLRQIRRARQKSVTCAEASNVNEVRQFYRILSDLYKRKLHKPLPHEELFVKFYEQDLGKYLLVQHDGQIIGGIMCPLLPGRALYEFYICSSDEADKELYPGVMATWSALEYACANNIPVFDFMGAGRPEEQYGVRDFKARFGGELVEYGRFLKIRKPLLYEVGKSVLNLTKRIGR